MTTQLTTTELLLLLWSTMVSFGSARTCRHPAADAYELCSFQQKFHMADWTDILAVCQGKSLIVSVLQFYNCFSYFIQAYAYVLSNARFVKLETKFGI